MKKIHEIKGVYDDDLPQLLEDLGLWSDFEKGNIHCSFSDEVVTLENFFSIYSDGKEIKFACDNEIARTKMGELREMKND